MRFSELGGGEVSDVPRRSVGEPSRSDPSTGSFVTVGEPSRSDPSTGSFVTVGEPSRSDPSTGSFITVGEPSPDGPRVPSSWERPTGVVESFVDGTLKAFAQAGLRVAAHAVGLGPVYEVGHLAVKATNTVSALASDHGAQWSLPVPVDGVDLMVSVTVGDDRSGDHCPVSLFVAPGEDSLAAAIDIEPAEQAGRAQHPAAKEAAEPTKPVPAADPAAGEHVQLYGQVAVATMDLSALENRSRADRVAALRELVVRELRPQLTKGSEQRDLALVIGYDPTMGLAFWTRIDRDPSRVWHVVAEYDLASRQLAIRDVRRKRNTEAEPH
jgi:hypothetical protein